MKKILITLALGLPMMCPAQSEWEIPDAQKPSTAGKAKTEKAAEAKNLPAGGANAEIKDWKYVRPNAVPETDGKVAFGNDIQLPATPAAKVYEAAYAALDSLAHGEQQIKSGIVLINRKEHIIVGRYSEWLEFSRTFMSLDRTKFNYTIIATCSDNSLHLSLERISYSYEETRSTGFKTNAENWIADKKALNKKGTKLLNGPAKFRKKTIDRKDEIFACIKHAVEKYLEDNKNQE